jgi:diguanylate cyclase (GGDEF)-like protein
MSKKEQAHIDNWITGDTIAVDSGETLAAAIRLMAKNKIGSILVTNGKALQGIFTERDLLNIFGNNTDKKLAEILDRPVKDFMTRDLVTAQVKDDYNTVYMKMKTHNIRHIPVLDGKTIAGIVSMRDLIHHYQNKLETSYNDARREIEELKELVNVSANEKIRALNKEIHKYKELSLTDELTGLFNKRYFQARFEEEVARAKRYKQRLSLIFCDIDFFKNINDQYGHQVGDRILRETADILKGAMGDLNVIIRLRKSDIIARYGGEEFVVILPETPIEGAVIVGERLRKVIESHGFSADRKKTHMTMSFGIAELREGVDTATDIIKRADHAMYVAKESGRNTVYAFREASE